MAVQVEFTEETNISGVYMTYCQTILEAFTKALDKNECNVRVLISAHILIKRVELKLHLRCISRF